MSNTRTLRTARKFLILGALLFCLVFVTLSRSTSPVKADDCNNAYSYLEACYDNCTWSGGSAICYDNCEMAHSDYGTTCNLPHYSPMLSSSYSCSRNSDQLLANCIAGQLAPVWQQRYIDQLVLQGGDMDAACTQLVWDYQNQECF